MLYFVKMHLLITRLLKDNIWDSIIKIDLVWKETLQQVTENTKTQSLQYDLKRATYKPPSDQIPNLFTAVYSLGIIVLLQFER